MSSRRQKRAQLRALECLAYSSSLSYLRSQSDCNQEAKYILEHLRTLLHISPSRHLAELRRIMNDEELERLVSLKNFGESNLKRTWIELEEKEDEDIKATSNLTTMKKKSKTS